MSDIAQRSLQSLPYGTSSFTALRNAGQIYVDKTDLICRLASERQKVFLSRPRRFGKSLLVSTFEALFSSGTDLFHGLKAEKLWREAKRYQVARLDFYLGEISDYEQFDKRFSFMLRRSLKTLGFTTDSVTTEDIINAFAEWLADVPPDTLVLLIDEYDSPLTQTLTNRPLLDKVRSTLSAFFATLKSNDGAFRFVFITGITKFNKLTVFSALNNFWDITVTAEFSTLLGYTADEVKYYFREHLARAADIHHTNIEDILFRLTKAYDGYSFDEFAAKRVFNPWSLLSYFKDPGAGCVNYWIESGGMPSALMKYMKNHTLRDPSEYQAPRTVTRTRYTASADPETLDDNILLAQTGYLTICAREESLLFLDYPNEEVREAMAQLYSEQLLKDCRRTKSTASALPD